MRDPLLPVRKGKVYCASWCGAGCTWAAHQKAVKESKALAKRLSEHFDVPFKSEVWENLGWHYRVSCGPPEFRLKVYASTYRPPHIIQYTTLLGVRDGGDPRWLSHTAYEDPIEAVNAQLNETWNVIQLGISGFSVLTKGMKSWRGK